MDNFIRQFQGRFWRMRACKKDRKPILYTYTLDAWREIVLWHLLPYWQIYV